MKTDLEIAHEAEMCRISQLLDTLELSEEHFEYFGKYTGKIRLGALEALAERPDGKLILITAMTPTRKGEGKTLTTVGMGQALGKLGLRGMATLREPSLGPVFGMKGGATGGGYSQLLPMEHINLHFNGDIHAVTTAHNLLTARRRPRSLDEGALTDQPIGLGFRLPQARQQPVRDLPRGRQPGGSLKLRCCVAGPTPHDPVRRPRPVAECCETPLNLGDRIWGRNRRSCRCWFSDRCSRYRLRCDRSLDRCDGCQNAGVIALQGRILFAAEATLGRVGHLVVEVALDLGDRHLAVPVAVVLAVRRSCNTFQEIRCEKAVLGVEVPARYLAWAGGRQHSEFGRHVGHLARAHLDAKRRDQLLPHRAVGQVAFMGNLIGIQENGPQFLKKLGDCALSGTDTAREADNAHQVGGDSNPSEPSRAIVPEQGRAGQA